MRLVMFAVLVLAAIALVWPLLRVRRRAPTKSGRTPLDELVKDPVCQMYVVRSRAIRRTADGTLRYFCSDDCARRYLSP